MGGLQSIKKQIAEKPVLSFYLMAFAFTWVILIPDTLYSLDIIDFQTPIFLLGFAGASPLISAMIVSYSINGFDEVRRLLKKGTIWKLDSKWYFFALFFFPIIIGLSLVLHFLFTGIIHPLNFFEIVCFLVPVYSLVAIFAIPEEFGWRGFALPRIQSRTNPLNASIIVGFLWTLWHLPLVFASGAVLATIPICLVFIDITGEAILYTWIINNTKGSVLIVILFHGSTNATIFLLRFFPSVSIGLDLFMIYFILKLAFTSIVVIYSTQFLKKRKTEKEELNVV